MSTTPTNQPVPSEKPQDLKFNAGKIDEFVTSMAKQYIDRFGQAHYTIEGLRWVAQQAISAFGYITMDSFQAGATLTLPNQVLRDTSTGEYYRWDGDLPKIVPSGSTPETTGGVGAGAWLSVGDATLRSEVYALEGGMARTFQTVSDMKGFEIEDGHLYRTSGYYAAGDGGDAFYLATTSGDTPDGYGDHVASNGVFLRLISQPTDLNHGIKINATFDPDTAWFNRNCMQSLLRNERWSYFIFKAQGTVYGLGGVNIGRDNITVEIQKGCKLIGRLDDPSIPASITSQAGGFIVFAHYFDPDNGDFTPWRPDDTRINPPTQNVHVILDGEISTEFNAIHSHPNNNLALGMLKAQNCSVKGSGGIGGSDHRGINFEGVGNPGEPNYGGSVNCHIDINYTRDVVNNHLMIVGHNTVGNRCTIKVGAIGRMLSGGFNNPIAVRTQGGYDFDIEIGSFNGDNIVKPQLVGSYGSRTVKVYAGYVNGASCLFRQYETLNSDVEAGEVYNTPGGIIRAGLTANTMRIARLHDIKLTDSNFLYAYSDQMTSNRDAFVRLCIENNYFGNSASSFVYYHNRDSTGLPARIDIRDNISPSGLTVTDLNEYMIGISGNLATTGAASAVVNYKSPDWIYTKLTVIVQAGGVYGSVTIDLRTRGMTSNAVAYTAGAYTINTTISGSTITLSATGGAVMHIVTLHN
ncbi:hypothetical protein [Citrobacter werkmanii]|uniref:tail fiber/spike domain-containing protein n=1 Tax=Citrobacter werkmanii TaxID=67827 RepID=UPI00300C5BF9